MPAKNLVPIWVEPEPGTESPKLPAAKGNRVDCAYMGLVYAVSPGDKAPAPYNWAIERFTFHGRNTGLSVKVGLCILASSVSPF